MRKTLNLTIVALLLLAPAFVHAGEPAAGKNIVFVNTKFKDEVSSSYTKIKEVLEGLAPGLKVDIVHYSKVGPAFLEQRKPDALVLGPQGTPWWEYDQKKLEAAREAVRRFKGPILGICGGHQFLATTFGGEVNAMECEPDHKGYKGCKKEYGFTKLKRLVKDPLLAGLPDVFEVMENHYEEVKKIPKGFKALAATELCEVQAMRLGDRPVYGVQFHPERHDEAHPHGRILLLNFLRLAGILPPVK